MDSQKEAMILDASRIKNDFYMNILDWGKNNVLAVALGAHVYLWNAGNRRVTRLLGGSEEPDNYPTSVSWSGDGNTVAVGFMDSKLELWDADTCKLVSF